MKIEDECQECKKIGKCGACPVMLNWVKEHRKLSDSSEAKKIEVEKNEKFKKKYSPRIDCNSYSNSSDSNCSK